MLSFEKNAKKLEIVTIDGSPVAFDSAEQERKMVLVTKAEERKLSRIQDVEERLKQFDKQLLALVERGWT